jgi:hypothetical protein
MNLFQAIRKINSLGGRNFRDGLFRGVEGFGLDGAVSSDSEKAKAQREWNVWFAPCH